MRSSFHLFRCLSRVSDPSDSIVLGDIKDPSTWKYYPYTRTWRVSFSNFESGTAVNLKSGQGFAFAKSVFSGYVEIYLSNDEPSIIDRGILGKVAPDGYDVSVTINDLPSGHSDSASGLDASDITRDLRFG